MKNLTHSLKAALISAFFICSFGAQAGIIFNVSSNNIIVGDTFSVDVILDNSDSKTLTSFAFDLNDETLQHVSYLGDTLLSPDYISVPNADVDKFVISPFAINNSQILLATLSFSALTAGTDTLTLLGTDGMFTGAFFDDFSYKAVDSSLQLTVSSASVPEPSALALMLLALGVFVRRYTKKA